MSTLDELKARVLSEHEALSDDYAAKQAAAETAWAAYEASKATLTAFRAEYGRVIKALTKETR